MNLRKLILAVLLLGCSSVCIAEDVYRDGWIDRNKDGKKDPYENSELPVQQRIADLIGQMTLDDCV